MASTIGSMKNEAIDVAGMNMAGAKSAVSAVISGVFTTASSLWQGMNMATGIGLAVTILTFWMTWYFKNEDRKRGQRREEMERAEFEEKQREREIRISLMLTGQSQDKLPKTESQMADLDLKDREVANG